MSSGIVITDDDMEKIPHHHKEIFKTLIANMNKTFHETLNQTRGRNPEQSQELDSWTSSQVLHMYLQIICQIRHYKNLWFLGGFNITQRLKKLHSEISKT